MRRCSIYDVLDAVDAKTGRSCVYTNLKGFKQLKGGDSFYIWTPKYCKEGDIALEVFEKDLAEDSNGYVYCVDGLDVIIL